MPGTQRTSPSFTPVLVVLLGIAAAYFAWNTTSKAEAAERGLQDGQRGEAYARSLHDYVDGQTEILRFLSGWYRLGQRPPGAGLGELLADMASDGSRHASLSYVGWAERVPAGQLAAFEAGRGLQVHGVDGESVPDENDHYVITQVYPDLPSQFLAGMDLATDPPQRQAIEVAAAGDRMVMSRLMSLVRPTPDGNNTGVLVAMPVYAEKRVPLQASRRREALAGAVIGVYSLDDLLTSALQPLENRDGQPAETVVVYEDGVALGSVGPALSSTEHLSSTQVDVCGHTWTLQTFPAGVEPLTVDQLFERPSLLLPGAIFIVMVLCAWIVWTLNRRNLVIQQQVAQQTAEMRQKNLVLEGKERELNDANRRLLEMSNTDPLTGILNRRAFEVQLDKERERGRRTGQSWGLLIFDVDQFKDYNDRYGHVAGDEVLRRVAGIIQNEARRIDTVARYGGEEFVVLTGGADVAGLLALGERIRMRIQEAAIPHESRPKGVLTVSGGGSLSTAAGGHDSRPVFEVADRCLYQAKSTGRNRIVMLA